MKTRSGCVGQKGEDVAAQFLIEKGYVILEKNYRIARFEVDIIAKINNTLVFVEVKTRTGHFFGHPEEAVNEKKQHNLLEAANLFLRNFSHSGETRFDVLSVKMNQKADKHTVNHIIDAFYQ